MKILMISHAPDNEFGGASRIYHMLAKELAERGHEVSVHHGEDAGIGAASKAAKLRTRLLMPKAVSDLGRTLNPQHFDVVFTSSGTGAPLYKWLNAKGGDRPLTVNHIHGLGIYDDLANRSEEWLGNWPTSTMYKVVTGRNQKRWDWQGVETADLTVVQNSRDLDWVERRLPTGRHVSFIPAAIHPAFLERSEVLDEGARRDDLIVWLASWEARKGAAYVPRAFRKLREAHPQMRLVIAGTSMDRETVTRQFDPRDRENIEVPAFMSMEEQIELFTQAAIFLFPSISEGFGLALPEIMAFGAAAVTTNIGFGGDFLQDGRDARIVPTNSVHIAKAMIELVENPAMRKRLGASGREIARAFTMKRMADSYEAEMLRLLRQRDRAG